jgi:hypothetical protein
MIRNIDIDLIYQPFIDAPPAQLGNLFERACSGDKPTIDKWKDIWIAHTKSCKERFVNFSDYSIGKLYGINRNKPAIICGSGPSLKHCLKDLKENAESPHPVLNISCLHNFGLFEDEGFHADYYLSLDSGGIVIQDVFESRKEKPEFYWEKTKDKILLATVMTDPKLFDLWQGKVYLFSVIIPEAKLHAELQSIEKFTHFVSCGGNALGGCFYIAKAIFSSNEILFVGADFCFDYDNTFHSYKTHYDTLGGFVPWTDCYGNLRKTWPSYLNFKFWFDHIACTIPGRYINCSEGLLGAYREGNIRQFEYKSLHDALMSYRMHDRVFLQSHDAVSGEVLTKEEINLKEYFNNPRFEKDLVLF